MLVAWLVTPAGGDMRLASIRSWRMSVRADEGPTVFALWLRDVEAIEVPPSPLVPGPLDVVDLPPPLGAVHDLRLGEEWLAWWVSLVERRPRPALSKGYGVEPAYDTSDPLGVARLPALRGYVTRRWTEFQDWRIAVHRASGTFASRRPADLRENRVVREVEAALGRKAAPFSLAFTLLPVRDDRIRKVGSGHYLVPERVYLGATWPAWLRTVVAEVA
jgi:hypothetical protein